MKNVVKIFLMICSVLFAGAGCDEEDPVQNSNDLIGSWQLAYYQTEENGRINAPNDGKPVYWNFKTDSTYEGKAGNNEIFGNYWTRNDSLVFTFYGSEMVGTEWEIRFSNALNHGWNGEAYVIPYSVGDSELVLHFKGNDTMHFLPIE
jgi:heat shock protein HslJ